MSSAPSPRGAADPDTRSTPGALGPPVPGSAPATAASPATAGPPDDGHGPAPDVSGASAAPAAPSSPPPSSCRRCSLHEPEGRSSPPSTMAATVIGAAHAVPGVPVGRGGPGAGRGPTLGSVHGDSDLLYVTQVAPYRDGPAGVHGVLDQSATAVAELAEAGRTGLPAGGRRAHPRPGHAGRGTGGGPVHHRRDPVDRRPAVRAPRRGAHRPDLGAGRPFGHRLLLRVGRVRAAGRRPLRRSPVDPASRSTCSIRPIRRSPTSARPGGGTTRCTSSATSDPTPRCCWRARCRRAGDGRRERRRAGGSGLPLSWCFSEGAGRVFSTSLGHFPTRGRAPPTSVTWPAASTGCDGAPEGPGSGGPVISGPGRRRRAPPPPPPSPSGGGCRPPARRRVRGRCPAAPSLDAPPALPRRRSCWPRPPHGRPGPRPRPPGSTRGTR